MNKSARRRAQFVAIYMPTICWKRTSIKHEKYGVNKIKLILMISISENHLVESEFFCFYKIRFVPSYGKVFVSTVAILFFMKQLP
jgi:hypothetical protein